MAVSFREPGDNMIMHRGRNTKGGYDCHIYPVISLHKFNLLALKSEGSLVALREKKKGKP